MYLRWAERNNMGSSSPTPEATAPVSRSVTFEVNGENAYGCWYRRSACTACPHLPFTPTRRRHTSFASVFVSRRWTTRSRSTSKLDDLRIDHFRPAAPGPARQHDGLGRAHRPQPTGIVVQCQKRADRSTRIAIRR